VCGRLLGAYLFPFFGAIAWQEIYLYSICEFMPLFWPGKAATMPGEIQFAADASMGPGWRRICSRRNCEGDSVLGIGFWGIRLGGKIDGLMAS